MPRIALQLKEISKDRWYPSCRRGPGPNERPQALPWPLNLQAATQVASCIATELALARGSLRGTSSLSALSQRADGARRAAGPARCTHAISDDRYPIHGSLRTDPWTIKKARREGGPWFRSNGDQRKSSSRRCAVSFCIWLPSCSTSSSMARAPSGSPMSR